MRISLMSALTVALISAGITGAQADQTYYNPANPASSTGFTNGYELFRTIGCPGKALFDKACDVPAPAPVAAPAPAPVAEPAPAPAPVAEPAPAPAPVAPAPMDSDHDGVVDALDKCPDTPAGDKVDENGCTIKNVIVLKGVNFDFDSAKLRPESYAILDHAVATLKQNKFPKTELAAYTDSVGKDAYNMKLSDRRAKAVKDYMVSKGCPADSLTSKGFGEADPIGNNKTKAGRFENRRVELHLQ